MFKSDPDQPDEDITHDYVMDRLVFHGSVNKVVDEHPRLARGDRRLWRARLCGNGLGRPCARAALDAADGGRGHAARQCRDRQIGGGGLIGGQGNVPHRAAGNGSAPLFVPVERNVCLQCAELLVRRPARLHGRHNQRGQGEGDQGAGAVGRQSPVASSRRLRSPKLNFRGDRCCRMTFSNASCEHKCKNEARGPLPDRVRGGWGSLPEPISALRITSLPLQDSAARLLTFDEFTPVMHGMRRI